MEMIDRSEGAAREALESILQRKLSEEEFDFFVRSLAILVEFHHNPPNLHEVLYATCQDYMASESVAHKTSCVTTAAVLLAPMLEVMDMESIDPEETRH